LLGSVERTDVVETEETSFENVESVLVLSVDPPRGRERSEKVSLLRGETEETRARFVPSEVEEEFLEYSLEELEILSSVHLSLNLEDSEGSPGVNGRVDISKVPFVSGESTIGFHVPFSSHDVELFLGVSGIDHGERNAVESGIPDSEEGVFPLVRHRKNVFDVEMPPVLSKQRDLGFSSE